VSEKSAETTCLSEPEGLPDVALYLTWFFRTFGSAQTKSSELTYASQQLGCSSGKAERLIA
jgi:hypothetical protein